MNVETGTLKVAVVYESLWGNTAAIARAIADGLGPGTELFSTAEAEPERLADARLLVVGAPLLGFRLPDESMLRSIAGNPATDPKPDTSQPAMKAWLEALPAGTARVAAFETRIWWSPGSAAKAILDALEAKGYSPLGREKFIVKGRYGPLKPGELERARAWGEALRS